MALTIKGRVYRVNALTTREFGDKVYYERELVIDATRHDMYTGEPGKPCFPLFTVTGEDRCRQLDSLNKGDLVELTFLIDGVKYVKQGETEERYFTKIICYKIDVLQAGSGVTGSAAQLPPLEQAVPPPPEEPIDDLPF